MDSETWRQERQRQLDRRCDAWERYFAHRKRVLGVNEYLDHTDPEIPWALRPAMSVLHRLWQHWHDAETACWTFEDAEDEEVIGFRETGLPSGLDLGKDQANEREPIGCHAAEIVYGGVSVRRRYGAFFSRLTVPGFVSPTDEPVHTFPVNALPPNTIPNVRWLTQMALSMDADGADTFSIRENYASDYTFTPKRELAVIQEARV